MLLSTVVLRTSFMLRVDCDFPLNQTAHSLVLSQFNKINWFYVSEQLVIYQVGVIPSQFYKVLSEKDFDLFKSLALYAVQLILINSMVSSFFYCYLTGIITVIA